MLILTYSMHIYVNYDYLLVKFMHICFVKYKYGATTHSMVFSPLKKLNFLDTYIDNYREIIKIVGHLSKLSEN